MSVQRAESLSDVVAQTTGPGHGVYLYRGQSRQWDPLPGLLREDNAPFSPEDLNACEEGLVEEFERRAPLRMGRRPEDWLETMTILQHYECPTRLLDWTGSPLVALLFSVSQDPSCDGVVWCLDVRGCLGALPHDELLSSFAGFDSRSLDRWLDGRREPQVIIPRHVTDRLAGQDGYFTMHSLSNEAGASSWWSGFAHQIVIPHQAKPRLFIQLKKAGISHATLYPDLGGLVKQIGWERTGWRSKLVGPQP